MRRLKEVQTNKEEQVADETETSNGRGKEGGGELSHRAGKSKHEGQGEGKLFSFPSLAASRRELFGSRA